MASNVYISKVQASRWEVNESVTELSPQLTTTDMAHWAGKMGEVTECCVGASTPFSVSHRCRKVEMPHLHPGDRTKRVDVPTQRSVTLPSVSAQNLGSLHIVQNQATPMSKLRRSPTADLLKSGIGLITSLAQPVDTAGAQKGL